MADVERVSLAIERDLVERFDQLLARSGHSNRSEAIRDLMRSRVVEEDWAAGRSESVATVTIVYDHTKRDLADRLLEAGHDHHRMIMATMHVHLDDNHCLEVMALRGKPADLRHFADHLIGMKGVRHGKLVMSSAGV
ncbi:MAG TPA: nickel-responsive transcriptional regulator NikR [Polyangiaceae bacterium]|nr:nickel-responsive transcriptional regulator NikR [Polyangiaceae bacterium]